MLRKQHIRLLSITNDIKVSEDSWDRVLILSPKDFADIYCIVSSHNHNVSMYSEDRIKELKELFNHSCGYDLKS